MNDINKQFQSLRQHAQGTISYNTPVAGVKASGYIDILDYVNMPSAAAIGGITVVDYTKLNEAAATMIVGITDYTQLVGKKVTVAGHDLTEGVDWTAATDNATTATSLAAAIHALAEVNAGAVGVDITITAAVAGAAGNTITVTTDATAGITVPAGTLSGGRDFATITVAGHALVAGTDFTAVTDNTTTATNLAAAIHALTEVNATSTGADVDIVAATAGVAGNSITYSSSAVLGAICDGTNLVGGRDATIVEVNGTSFIAGVDFVCATSNAVTATNLAVVVNALASLGAAAVGDRVNITADAEGTAGNSITLSSTSGFATVSGATLAGGVNGDTVVVNGTTFTCVTSAPGANEFTNIAGLTALITALANINATDDGVNTITVNADAIGTTGNTYTLSVGVGNVGDMAVSGATLTGGVASSVSDWYTLEEEAEAIFAVAYVDTLTGTSATVNITPELSTDQEGTEDGDAFAQFTTTGNKNVMILPVKHYIRWRVVLGGTSPIATIRIHAEPREVDSDSAATELLLTDIDTQVTTIVTRMGEVQASPTANTLLGRLKEIETDTGSLDTKLGEVQVTPTSYTVLSRLKAIGDYLATVLSVGGNVEHDAVDAGNPVKIGGKGRTSRPTAVANDDRVNAYLNEYGAVMVSLDTGLNSTDDSVAAMVAANANISGFDTLFDADGDNTAQAIKVTAGNLYHLHIINTNAAVAYVQLFDLATASITVGTTTPKFVIQVPASGNTTKDYIVPMSFATAISYACTTTPTGNGDPTTGLTVSIGYK